MADPYDKKDRFTKNYGDKYTGDGKESPEDLEKKEQGIGSTSSSGGSAHDDELARLSPVGKGYRGGDKAPLLSDGVKGMLTKGLGTVKRNPKKSAGVALGGGIAGFIIFLAGILQGPLQLIHLGEILRKPTIKSDNDNTIRAGAIIRYWQSGDIGQTRLSYYGSKVAAGAQESLRKQGVEAIDRNARGRPGAFEIDAKKNDVSKDIGSQKDQIRALSQSLGIQESEIKPIGGDKFRIDTPSNNEGLDKSNKILSFGLKAEAKDGLVRGDIHTANQHRVLKKLFGLPALFSPWEKLTGNKLDQYIERMQKAEERAKERRNERLGRAPNYTGPVRAKIDEAGERFRSKPSIISAAGRGLQLQGALCFVKGVAELVPVANRAAVVAPAVLETNSVMSKASQGKSGEKLSLPQAGVTVDGFSDDEGGTVWQSKALDALGKNGRNAKGKDIEENHKQAFMNNNAQKELEEKFGVRVEVLGVTVNLGGALCNPVAQIGGTILGGIFTGLSCTAGAVGTAGTSCAVAAGRFASSSIVMYQIAGIVSQQLAGWLAEENIDWESLPADQRGSLMAYAARESANINARQSGGTMLNDSDQKTVMENYDRIDKEVFQNKSFFARIFDLSNYRSLASTSLRQVNFNVNGSASLVSSTMTSLSQTGGNLTSAFMPKLLAQSEETYSWDFPLYGVPLDVFNGEDFENPYDNAEKVAVFFGDDEDHEYIQRGKQCFGVNISKDSDGRWEVQTDEEEGDVNPQSADYHNPNSDCNEDSIEWRRVQMFVFDSKLMVSMACYDGDEEACGQLGATATAPESEGSESAGSNIDLENIREDSTGIDCAEGTKDVGVHDGYTEGQKVPIRVCAVSNIPSTGQESNNGYGVTGADGKLVVNSRVSGAVYAMVEAAKKDGVTMTAASGFRTMAHQQALCPCDGVTVARPGYSNHQLGVAIDFGGNGVLMNTSNPMWKWLDENAAEFDYYPYEIEPWHWSPLDK
jgi:hypothetical protein